MAKANGIDVAGAAQSLYILQKLVIGNNLVGPMNAHFLSSAISAHVGDYQMRLPLRYYEHTYLHLQYSKTVGQRR